MAKSGLLQHQRLKSPSTAPSTFTPQTRPSTPITSSSPTPTPLDEQASLEHARRFRASIEHMSIFPREQRPPTHPIQRKRPLTKQRMQQQDRSEIQEEHVSREKNQTGLPDTLKVSIESLSGLSLDDVHVYYNSPKPAQLDALAYTQGTEIHVGPQQEKHVPHEAWHVVQQKLGLVQPVLRAQRVGITDDPSLEREADMMGAKALQTQLSWQPHAVNASVTTMYSSVAPVQAVKRVRRANGDEEDESDDYVLKEGESYITSTQPAEVTPPTTAKRERETESSSENK